MIMDIPVEVLEEVGEVTTSAARNVMRVDWMDEALGNEEKACGPLGEDIGAGG